MRVFTESIGTFEGKEVELAGWVHVRRDHGKLIFIDIRDRSGIAQVVFTPDKKEIHALADRLRPEWVVRLKGTVGKRPKGMENPKIESGLFEVNASELDVLAEAETPPFEIAGDDGRNVNEEVRMRYRYLDLRRERLQNNLRKRAESLRFIRNFLSDKEFIEVETPVLGRSTPEGARDYLVPSRVYPGSFYALPQSPQQYKQLLMVAGVERYFQVVRCFRDEDTRGDRQPEFTQLDMEMSFASREEILEVIEELFVELVTQLFPEKKIQTVPFPRIPYKEAMEKYGSDKPDLRKDKSDPNELAFTFIVDFPMFEWKEEEKRWDAAHHPFTMPQVEDRNDFKKRFEKDPASIQAHQYDLALNGFEIAGGSLRIHDPALLQAVFEAMGNKKSEVREKFGHMLEAFTFGVPPHGGIASGLDRVFAVLLNEPNIRETMAFPKTGDGRDLLFNAPAAVSDEQLKELHITVEKEEKEDAKRQ